MFQSILNPAAAGPRRVGTPCRLIIWRPRQADKLASLKKNILLIPVFRCALPGVWLHRNVFLSFASNVFPFCRPQLLPQMLFPFYPWPSSSPRPATLVSHTCRGFLLLSILISCPNHLSLLLSNILVTGS